MYLRRLAGPVRFSGPLAAIVLLVVLATGCGSPEGPATITFWSWVPGLKDEVQLYNDTHKNVTVKYVNAGQGADEYTKLRTALKADKGAPDVVQIEFQYIPSFTQIDALADISQYGANDVKNEYVD
jgi:multiple sugar transport system substrate-binding protein